MHNSVISKDMTILDVVCEHEDTDKVFSSYDERAGECICCNSLFETIEAAAQKYSLDLDNLINDLEKAVRTKDE